MANVLSLAMKISADASSVQQSLTPVDRALNSLSQQAEKATAAFDPLTRVSAAAAEAQAGFASRFAELSQQLRDGALAPREYAAAFAALSDEARDTADAFREGAQITERNRDAEESRAIQLDRLQRLLALGAIGAREYGLEVAKLSSFPGTGQQERFGQVVAGLQQQLQSGTISLEEFTLQASRLAATVSATVPASERTASAILGLQERFDAGSLSAEEYRAQLEQIESGTFTSTFDVEVLGVREGVAATEELQAALSGLTSTQLEAALEVSGAESLEELRFNLFSIDGAEVDAIVSVLGAESIDDARDRLNALSQLQVSPVVGVDGVEETRARLLQLEERFGSLAQAGRSLDALSDVDIQATFDLLGVDSIEAAKASLLALGSVEVVSRLNTVGFESIDAAREALNGLQDRQVTATLEFLGDTQIEEVGGRLAALDQSQIEAFLSVTGFESIDQAQERIASLTDFDVQGTLSLLGVETVDEARTRLESLSELDITPALRFLGVDSIDQVQARLDQVNGQEVIAQLQANGIESIEEAQRIIASLEGKNVEVIAEALGIDSIETLTAVIDAVEPRTIAVTAEANTSDAARAIAALDAQVRAGVIGTEAYNAAVQRLEGGLTDAERAARGLANATEEVAQETLKFNELSGVFAILPGPIGNIAGRLSGLTSAAEGLNRVFAGGFTSGISNVAASFTALANPATIAAAGIAGVGAAAAAITSGLVALEDRVERLGNQAFQLGVSFEFVQVLEESAIRSGTSVDVLRSATTRLQQQLVEAANGGEKAQAAIAGLGLSAEELAAASPDEQFRLIASAITSIEDPAERTAAATRLFGEAGVQLLPFFRNLGVAAEDMERLNGQLSSVDRTRIEELGTSFDGVNVALRGLGQELLTPFIGIARSISDSLAPTIAVFGRNIGALLDAFSPITSVIGLAINQFLQLGSTISNIVGTVLEPFAAYGRLISGVFDDISQATTSVFQPVNDLVLSFREFFQFEGVFNGIRDAVSSLGETFSAVFGRIAEIVQRVITIVTTAFGQLTGVVQRFIGGTVSRVTSVVSAFAEFTGLADVVRGFASAVTSAFSGLWDGIRAIVGQVGGFIERVLNFAENWLGISREIEQPVTATIEVNAPQAIQLTEDLAKAQESVAEFGNAGVQAFLEYQAQLEDIAELVAEGEYDGEAQERAIAQATAEFERQRDILQQQAEEQEKLAEAEQRRAEQAEEAARRQVAADQQVIDNLLRQQRIEEEFGGDSNRARAADNLLAIEREIARIEEEQRAAREAGNVEGANAAAERLAQLDQVAARERDIASGAAAEREEIAKAADQAAREAERVAEQRRREEERIQKSIEQAQERYADRAAEIDAERVGALNSALRGPIEVGDLRSAEGAAAFLNLASGAEDPAIAEYRKQLKELQGLRRDLQALETQKAEILAGTG